jgi:NAD(P)-dependent dehydrogenase (short-subunit alcohol dehydrogenase family)
MRTAVVSGGGTGIGRDTAQVLQVNRDAFVGRG